MDLGGAAATGFAFATEALEGAAGSGSAEASPVSFEALLASDVPATVFSLEDSAAEIFSSNLARSSNSRSLLLYDTSQAIKASIKSSCLRRAILALLRTCLGGIVSRADVTQKLDIRATIIQTAHMKPDLLSIKHQHSGDAGMKTRN